MPARRILILNERDRENPLAGGAEVNTHEIFGRLADRGHEVTLLAAGFSGGAAKTELDGMRVRRFANRYAYYGILPFAVRGEVRRGDYDVVVDVLCKLAFLSPFYSRVPCLAFAHHLFGDSAFRQVSFPVASVSYGLEKLIPFAYRDSPFVAVSPSTRDDLIERGIDREQIFVVPNGVDTSVYSPDSSVEKLPPTVVWLGRVEPYKRADIALRAMRKVRASVPDARLVVVGDGHARADLERLARDLGVESYVEFAGFVSEEQKVGHLRSATVLAATSEKEGWGLTVVEGNACGVPTVASDVEGYRDSVIDGETGYLVPFADEDALADALVCVLTDRALASRLSAGALDWAKRFTWDSAADSVEKIIDALARKHTISTVDLPDVSFTFDR